MLATSTVFQRIHPGVLYGASLASGPLVLLLTLITAPPEGMSLQAWHMFGVANLMALWWVFEVVPLPVTALVPMVLAPLLGISSIGKVTAMYANPTIFLFFGGFMLGLAMERWNLHKRIALHIMLLSGGQASRQIAGFMLATAFLSMWVSNTATSVMMLPIGMSVATMYAEKSSSSHGQSFTKALLLAIAYSASIGGLGTLIGTPPNALLAAFLEQTYNLRIGFAQWMLIGVPVSLLMLLACWIWLTRFAFKLDNRQNPQAERLLQQQLQALGPLSSGEKMIAVIFLLTVTGWIFRPVLSRYIPGLSDTAIALTACLLLFIIPVRSGDREFLMSWEKTRDLPWGILLLFGGGLALAALVKNTGLTAWTADAMGGVNGLPTIMVIALVVSVIIFLTELTSNTATAAGFLPLMGALAITLGIDPVILTVPAALAASCAFMMPVATPPNAVVFGSEKLALKDMIRAGLALNLVGIVLITAISYLLVDRLFSGL